MQERDEARAAVKAEKCDEVGCDNFPGIRVCTGHWPRTPELVAMTIERCVSAAEEGVCVDDACGHTSCAAKRESVEAIRALKPDGAE